MTWKNDPEIRKLMEDAQPGVARAFFIAQYLKLPKGKELADDEYIRQALQKLPFNGPITLELDVYAVRSIGYLLPEISKTHPDLPSFLAAYKSALNRVRA